MWMKPVSYTHLDVYKRQAQGFALMRTASEQYGWKLDLSTIALLWRAGCIIRSAFLNDIAEA